MKDYYYILGVNQDSSFEEIKKAYRKLSLKFHPDKNDGDDFFSERFKEIQEAYETLSDSSKRSNYNYRRQNFNNNTLDPEIEQFTSNKREFNVGDIISFSWKTKNADIVFIKPIGQVNIVGTKSYRIKNTINSKLTFELSATNSISGKATFKNLTINRKEPTNKESLNTTKRKNEYKRSKGISKLIFVNAILKPIIVFGTITLIIYLIIKMI